MCEYFDKPISQNARGSGSMKYESLEIDGVLYNLVEIEKYGVNFELLIIVDTKSINGNLLKFISNRKIKAVTISFEQEKDLVCLKDAAFKQVEFLNLVGDVIEDINEVATLKNLISFSFQGVFLTPFDFSELKKLKMLEILYNHGKTNGISKCEGLEHLRIYHYKSKTKSLEEFSSLTNLKSLNFRQSHINSLDGLKNLKSLYSLDLCYLRNLQNISALNNNESIVSLTIQYAKKISDWGAIGTMKNLKGLLVHSCGIVKNLDFLKGLNNLEHLRFTDTKFEEDVKWIFDAEEFKNTKIIL